VTLSVCQGGNDDDYGGDFETSDNDSGADDDMSSSSSSDDEGAGSGANDDEEEMMLARLAAAHEAEEDSDDGDMLVNNTCGITGKEEVKEEKGGANPAISTAVEGDADKRSTGKVEGDAKVGNELDESKSSRATTGGALDDVGVPLNENNADAGSSSGQPLSSVEPEDDKDDDGQYHTDDDFDGGVGNGDCHHEDGLPRSPAAKVNDVALPPSAGSTTVADASTAGPPSHSTSTATATAPKAKSAPPPVVPAVPKFHVSADGQLKKGAMQKTLGSFFGGGGATNSINTTSEAAPGPSTGKEGPLLAAFARQMEKGSGNGDEGNDRNGGDASEDVAATQETIIDETQATQPEAPG